MPSVMTTHSGIDASTASSTALLAKAGGTKATDTSAPVSLMASATVANTGTCKPSTSTVLPALRGLTPPTTCEPDDERVADLVTTLLQQGEGLHDPVRHLVAGGDPAEHVDEHGLHVRVAQDDLQPVGHHLGRRTAPDVEEVRRLDPSVLLPGIGDHVERRHHQAGTVADDADGTVELDVVEVLGLGLRLQRVGRELVLQAGV